MSANPKLPTDLSAKRINEQHKLASQAAETAVQHAMLCGELLSEKKEALKHGEFESWVEKHCDFSARTARRYMQAAKSDTRDAFESLRQALGYATKPKAVEESNRTRVSVLDTPADPAPAEFIEAAKGIHIPSKTAEVVSAEVIQRPSLAEFTPEDDEDEILARAEAEYTASIDKVMSADDKLAAAHAEIKRQAAEIAVLKISRDGYMNGKAAMTELLKKEQRKNERLEKEIKKLRDAK